MKNRQNENFIIRCLKASASPSGVCRYRDTFSWLQIFFLFIFLTSCLAAPLAISFMKMERFNIRSFMPAAIQELDQSFADQLKGYQLSNGKLTGSKGFVRVEEGSTLLAADMEYAFQADGENGRLKVNGYANAILFQPDHLIISDQNGTGFSVRYVKRDVKLKEMTAHDLEAFIGEAWLAQYKPMIMMLAFSLIFISQLFMSVMLAGGLWITKKSKMTGIASFKEASAAAVCGSAVPAFAAAAAGLIYFDLITVLLIHSCGVVLMISFTFSHLSKTRHHNGKLQSGGNHDKSAAI
ncbi:DUF1189 family protein [Bacillus swezeyi]|uniref:DUF1189 domain-containing protein n=1 Tax=Bacillus swezeyi TaxID=1925020 RepID=A0A1R1QZQ1_9BACI|nr:DUF1189 family protein [Bacillus swezeyi]MEC1259854.1 DUF1189 family protein [Bacillus swezeyi]MED2930032.1 DUF1189 family protein [Bacillus swezeyi]MED2963077.1 DUF1189 family protein [Bacillus swezeyi]MED3074285.1 DUF1189 family protein [Bacillus swezeyi]MED3083535.1 DUF1189 family protein [Bacillus swezeyi]